MKKLLLSGLVISAVGTTAVVAGEVPIGEAVMMNNMEIAAVYLQPITMEPQGLMRPASQSDVHLEADIHATKGNVNGLGAGEWVPYLTIDYKLTNTDTGKTKSGTLMPMVASDGPHYGQNIKMLGVGNYKLTWTIKPPVTELLRHTDKETGVGKWFKPFDASYTFKYLGAPKP
ncbi:MAG: iron transporter [Gammaproteobacteria bacterium]|nr:MAG: iron transporter [Gammaproteobacteria bacterium]